MRSRRVTAQAPRARRGPGASSSRFLLSSGSAGAGGGGARGCAPAGVDEGGDAVEGGSADEAVDGSARCVRVAEVHAAEDPGDEIELRDADEAPVEAADEHEGGGEQVELLHLLYTSCIDVVRDPTARMLLLSNFCPDVAPHR